VELTCELLLLVSTVGQRVHAKGALAYQDVWPDGRDLGDDEVPVLFPRVVARVQNLEAGNLYHKHARAENVAGVVGREAQATRHDDILVIVDRNDGLPRRLDIGFVVQQRGLVRSRIAASARLTQHSLDAHRVHHC
jgi:hypothetical protein